MSKLSALRGKWATFLAVTWIVLSSGGCLPQGFGSDLLGSTIAAIWSDVLYTVLDWVLPKAPQ